MQTEREGPKTDTYTNGNQKKKAKVAILISDKTYFKINTITRDKNGHYIMIKGSIQEEYKTITNKYTCAQHSGTSMHKANAVLCCAKLLQSCLTLSNPMDCSLPGSSVCRILQGRILEWDAVPSPSGSSRPRDWTCVCYISCIGKQVLYH